MVRFRKKRESEIPKIAFHSVIQSMNKLEQYWHWWSVILIFSIVFFFTIYKTTVKWKVSTLNFHFAPMFVIRITYIQCPFSSSLYTEQSNMEVQTGWEGGVR